jgi:Uncharacterised nucleotidyltransferase
VKGPLLTPPHVPIDGDLSWLLRAAFAEQLDGARPTNAARAVCLARATQTSGRVAKRLLAKRGASRPVELAGELDGDYFANVATEALLMEALEGIAELADRLGVPIIAAKFAGLRLAGVISPGTRVVSDLDLLLPKAESRRFWRALLEAGFTRTRTHEYAHQLEALVSPHGATIDLHLHLPGVSVERGGFATADHLLARGLVRRTSGSVLVPNHALLAAHAIAHALLQNRATPQTYSPLRMVADIIDLRRVDPLVMSQAPTYLAPELRTICEALERLCVRLADGAFEGPGFDETEEQALLWHCLAARLDPAYSERLRAAGFANKLRDGTSLLEVARYIGDLLYPSEPALEHLYGPAAGSFARARRRLKRPVDLVLRAARRWARARGG